MTADELRNVTLDHVLIWTRGEGESLVRARVSFQVKIPGGPLVILIKEIIEVGVKSHWYVVNQHVNVTIDELSLPEERKSQEQEISR